MNNEMMWQQYAALPADAQWQVADFVAFLARRYATISNAHSTARPALIDEPVIGMWADRVDMDDSSAWVRAMRDQEWNRLRGTRGCDLLAFAKMFDQQAVHELQQNLIQDEQVDADEW